MIQRIANWSLPPGKTCSSAAQTTCFTGGCYARKAYRMYRDTRKAWDENYEVCRNDLATFITGMNLFLSEYKNDFFRVHTSGDFFNAEYAEAWAKIARDNPQKKLLAFTKQFDSIRGIYFPPNFTLVLSAWPGNDIPDDLLAKYHVAWMQDGTETRIPAETLHCPGDCTTCGACWGLNRDTYFTKH